jgi:hypothetical protein
MVAATTAAFSGSSTAATAAKTGVIAGTITARWSG